MSNESQISAFQAAKNCWFAVREIFLFRPFFSVTIVLLQIVTEATAFVESTYLTQWLITSIERRAPFSQIAVWVILFFALQILVGGLSWLHFGMLREIVATRFSQHFNKKIFRKAANIELSCYEAPSFYDRYTRAADGMPERLLNVNDFAIGVVCIFCRVIALISVMISIDPGVGVFLIFPMIGNFIFAKKLNDLDQKRYQENTKSNRILSYVQRVLHLQQFAKEVRITDIYPLMERKMDGAVNDICRVQDRYAFGTAFAHWGKVQFVFTVFFEGTFAYCAYRALVGGTISLAQMTVITAIMGSASYAIMALFENLNGIQKEGVYIQNARDFLSYKERIPENQPGLAVPHRIETLEFRNVSFSYQGSDRKVLDGISFLLPGNKTVALVGHNGAGKSTFVKLLLRLYDPDEGEILLNGVNIKEYALAEYRKLFSAAFQDYQVIAMSVLENLTMGEHFEHEEEAAWEVLKKVGLSQKVSGLEHGLHTVMTREFDDHGVVFSGGEGQKLAVARALMKNSACMVLDEPSSALDPIAEHDLFETIMQESANRTTVIISHRLSSVQEADEILMFDGGKLVETGTHGELMKQKGAYARMFRYQACNYLAITGEEAGCNA